MSYLLQQKSIAMMPLVILALMLVALGSVAVAHQGASGIVKDRMDRFSDSQKQLKRLIGYAQAGQFDEAEQIAGDLAKWAEEMPSYFPEGSMQKPSQARPEIWLDFTSFTEKADVFRRASLSAGNAAAAQDRAGLTAAIKQVANSCKSCHTDFRMK